MNNISNEFSSVQPGAIELDFLSKYLPIGDKIFVNPISGFITSQRYMSANDVAKYWSDKIFPDKSEQATLLTIPLHKLAYFMWCKLSHNT